MSLVNYQFRFGITIKQSEAYLKMTSFKWKALKKVWNANAAATVKKITTVMFIPKLAVKTMNKKMWNQ